MLNVLKDTWLLFGRLFPFPTKPGLRRVGNPDRSSPVLVTCNFELTVREVIATLTRDGIDCWLLVAPTKGVNVWCAGGAGDFTTDTVISILRTSGIEAFVDHRRLILPQLSANGVNIWSLRDRTGWRPQFGPAHIKDLAAFLKSGKSRTEKKQRLVRFGAKDRLVMGTNLGFNVSLLLVLPLLLGSIWVAGLWWKTIPLLFLLSVVCSLLVFWLPGKVGVQKGFSLGLLAAAVFVVAANLTGVGPWAMAGWTAWIVLLAVFVGYDLPSWSPLWRQDVKELVLGVKTTHVEVIPEKCISCHMCDVVCPVGVFAQNPGTKKFEVVNLAACIACGACIENCPTEAIVNNFRESVCSCPTCYVIEGAGSIRTRLSRKKSAEPPPAAAAPEPGSGCGTPGRGCAEEPKG
ncbi:MAG: 4Fe-4S binding protein [Gemmataceae bacterium]|nr:4Fe-4S binding protein [Gemmataceae bacterium]